MEDRLDRIEQMVHAIHQALVGYNGRSGGLIGRVDALEQRVSRLEQRGLLADVARTLVAGFAGLFGGRMGGAG